MHEHLQQVFKREVVKSFKRCLDRQMNEAVRIISSKSEIVLNRESDFDQAPIARGGTAG